MRRLILGRSVQVWHVGQFYGTLVKKEENTISTGKRFPE